jgi:hypothetical protein
MEMFRQGDVLMTHIARLPEGLNGRQSKLLLTGEVARRLAQGRVRLPACGTLFLEISQRTQVVHEEHNPLTLEPSFYRITRQREYTALGHQRD